jgi:hypothetical protein
VLVGLGASVLAQPAAAPAQSAEVEETIVLGRTPENLRVEIERVEAAVYERWNALNSDDELDIHCFEQAPTRSNIPLRTCAPNFVARTESAASRKMLKDGRTGAGNNNNPAEQRLSMEEKSQKLADEMQRLARGDEQLLRGLVRLDELKQQEARERAGHNER